MNGAFFWTWQQRRRFFVTINITSFSKSMSATHACTTMVISPWAGRKTIEINLSINQSINQSIKWINIMQGENWLLFLQNKCICCFINFLRLPGYCQKQVSSNHNPWCPRKGSKKAVINFPYSCDLLFKHALLQYDHYFFKHFSEKVPIDGAIVNEYIH